MEGRDEAWSEASSANAFHGISGHASPFGVTAATALHAGVAFEAGDQTVDFGPLLVGYGQHLGLLVMREFDVENAAFLVPRV